MANNKVVQTKFHNTPEQKLWLAVIGAAATDAVEMAKFNIQSDQRKYGTEHEEYFLNPNRNFYMVCQYAGLDPEYVKRKMRKAIYDKRKQGYLSPLQR